MRLPLELLLHFLLEKSFAIKFLLNSYGQAILDLDILCQIEGKGHVANISRYFFFLCSKIGGVLLFMFLSTQKVTFD